MRRSASCIVRLRHEQNIVEVIFIAVVSTSVSYRPHLTVPTEIFSAGGRWYVREEDGKDEPINELDRQTEEMID